MNLFGYESADALRNEIESHFCGCEDFVMRSVSAAGADGFICFFKNVTERKYIADRIMNPITDSIADFDGNFSSVLQSTSLKIPDTLDKAYDGVLHGDVFCVIERGNIFCALCGADSQKGRTPDETNSDITVKGPKVGFVENVEENMAQLRRIIRSEKLKFTEIKVGKLTATRVVIAYVEGRAHENVIGSIKSALENADDEYIVDSGNIQMILEGNRFSFLPALGSTEKVDKAASKLLSGRVGIICDGSPFVLTAPYVFVESIQSAEDYTKTPYYATFIRTLRFAAMLLSLLAPAVFIAVMYYHTGAVPKRFIDLINELDKDIPFSVFGEVLIMLIVFEIIREVGLRMPRTVGDAVGIVGSIILGDAAVEAGIASTIVIIIVALSAISGFIVPTYMNVTVLLRFLYLFAAFASGFYGIGAALVITVVCVARKKSFGVPYLTPVYPLKPSGLLDTLLVIPRKVLGRREL